jgi:Protein of unknown function (DUF3916)
MRRLSLTNKKVRGVPRRLRSLARWAAGFKDRFPTGIDDGTGYLNYKIPVLSGLVEGKQASRSLRRDCAQFLIDACFHLMECKPPQLNHYRVVATICIPDMWTSEVCIYLNQQYILSQMQPSENASGATTLILDRRLSSDWGLRLPMGFEELGIRIDNHGDEDRHDWYISEHWYFGEVR